VEHAGPLEVRDIARSPGDFVQRIEPGHRTTNDAEGCPGAHAGSPRGSAQAAMASTIF
jgi:hypothetical protein